MTRLSQILSSAPPADLAADAVAMAVMIASLPFVPLALALLKALAS